MCLLVCGDGLLLTLRLHIYVFHIALLVPPYLFTLPRYPLSFSMNRLATPEPSLPEAGPSRPGALSLSWRTKRCLLTSLLTALFQRLHALLPQGPLHTQTPSHDGNSSLPTAQPRQPTILKVRIVTWNMHESLPKVILEFRSLPSNML